MGEVRPDTFREAVQQISRAGTPILGYILNKVKTRRFGYYSRYKYYHYYPSREDSGPSGPGRAPVRKPMEEPARVSRAGDISLMPVVDE